MQAHAISPQNIYLLLLFTSLVKNLKNEIKVCLFAFCVFAACSSLFRFSLAVRLLRAVFAYEMSVPRVVKLDLRPHVLDPHSLTSKKFFGPLYRLLALSGHSDTERISYFCRAANGSLPPHAQPFHKFQSLDPHDSVQSEVWYGTVAGCCSFLDSRPWCELRSSFQTHFPEVLCFLYCSLPDFNRTSIRNLLPAHHRRPLLQNVPLSSLFPHLPASFTNAFLEFCHHGISWNSIASSRLLDLLPVNHGATPLSALQGLEAPAYVSVLFFFSFICVDVCLLDFLHGPHPLTVDDIFYYNISTHAHTALLFADTLRSHQSPQKVLLVSLKGSNLLVSFHLSF